MAGGAGIAWARAWAPVHQQPDQVTQRGAKHQYARWRTAGRAAGQPPGASFGTRLIAIDAAAVRVSTPSLV